MRVPIISNVVDVIAGKKEDPMEESMYVPAELPKLDLNEFTNPEFQNELNRKAELNLKVDSKDALIKFIETTGFSMRFENAAKVFVQTYYDRNILLSDLSGKKIVGKGITTSDERVQITYWNAKIDFIGLYNSTWPSDRRNPNFITFMNAVMTQIRLRLPRAKGRDRESILMRRVDINYQATQAMQAQRTKGE